VTLRWTFFGQILTMASVSALLCPATGHVNRVQQAEDGKHTASNTSPRDQGAKRRTLSVCADPNNLPFSNAGGAGFENKLAELLAQDLNERLVYTWWSERKGFVRNTLQSGRCDILLGLPKGFPGVLTTEPYYRSTYVFVSRRARGLQLHSLDSPVLRRMRIGIHVVGDDYAPPAQLLASHGMINNIVGFSLFGRYAERNPAAKIIDAVAEGQIDMAVVWGPLAGYFARREAVPLRIEPVSSPAGVASLPLEYGISLAVRTGDRDLGARLNRFVEFRHRVIEKLLRSYSVPLVDTSGVAPRA
jgi:mxaJ protein